MTEQVVPVAAAAEIPTERGWLFSKEGQEILPTDPAQYEQLWKEGWRNTPTAFGIETHPTSVPRTLSTPAPVSVPGASPPEAARLVAAEQRLGAAVADLAILRAEVESLTGRVAVLEGRPHVPTEPDEPARPGRK